MSKRPLTPSSVHTMHPTLATALTGGLFGSALTVSGVASPQIIINQLQLKDFHMLLTFLTASACSASIFALADYTNFATIARKDSTGYGWVNRFDGNVTGGLLLGLGMGLTGACPGTMVVQSASGVPNSRLLLTGAMLGGILFVKWSQSHPVQPCTTRYQSHDRPPSARGAYTARSLLFGYEAVAVLTILAISQLAPRGQYPLHPVLGGMLIGLAQAASVLVSRKPLGVSGAYEDIGRACWALVQRGGLPSAQNSIFLGSMFVGAKAVLHAIKWTGESLSTSDQISPFSSLLGGFLLVFGARLGGGCTTGHGISGMSSLGVGSFISVSSMFGSGIGLALTSA